MLSMIGRMEGKSEGMYNMNTNPNSTTPKFLSLHQWMINVSSPTQKTKQQKYESKARTPKSLDLQHLDLPFTW
jgi:hypothetical protein